VIGSRRRSHRWLSGVLTAAALSIVAATAVTALPETPPARAADVTVMRKIPYVEGGSTNHQIMDVYIPSGDPPFPGVVVIHGGGWKSGSVAKFAQEAQFLANKGFVAFAVTYRLAPQFTYPDQVEDVQSAVKYIRAHHSEFKVDPKWLGALGGSAGAHLAAMLGDVGHGATDTGSRVNVVVAWSAPFDLTIAARRGEIGHPQSRHRPVELFLGCSLEACPDRYQEASPINHVDGSDPPMFIANATLDETSLPGAEAMNQALQQAGVPSKLVVVPCRCHSDKYELLKPPELGGETVFDASVDWLKQHIKGQRQSSEPPTPPPSPQSPLPPKKGNGALLALIVAIAAVAAITLGLALARRRR
jgi:acetyl esterase